MSQPSAAVPRVQLAAGIVGGLAAFGATFYLAGEEHYPGRFFVTLQATWMNDSYYLKLTWLLTLLTLVGAIAAPIIFVTGSIGFVRALARAPVAAPPDWDLTTAGRRARAGVAFFLFSLFWIAFLGVCIAAPELLKPLGFVATMLLTILPVGLFAVPALLFEALIPPRFVAGPIDSLVTVENQGRVSTTITVAGDRFQPTPDQARGLREGARVQLLASGFLNTVLRLEAVTETTG